MIKDLAKNIPKELRNRSGSVFYSGRDAFSGSSKLYILGINPGGNPVDQAEETVDWHTRKVLDEKPGKWSEYGDESWEGYAPGKWGMQPRILHLFHKLHLEPGNVPSSNVIFVRSRDEQALDGDMHQLAEACWPFHQAVIEQIRPRVILCLGQTAGNFVQRNTGARDQIDEFVESNNRGWRSRSFTNHRALTVVVATHPGRVDWTNPDADPSGLVKRALEL